jgi:hypothetical protein
VSMKRLLEEIAAADGPAYTDVRRDQIVRLMRSMWDGLPEAPALKSRAQSGFVDAPRHRECPDCLANGRPIAGCETCGGISGKVPYSRVGLIALPDARPEDGEPRDPYKVTGKEATIGYADYHDQRVALDVAIARAPAGLGRFGVGRPLNTEEEIAEAAKSGGERWERERNDMRKNFDYGPLIRALDELRVRDAMVCTLLRASVVNGLSDPSVTFEAAVELGFRFVSSRMPDPMRAPGDAKHPALSRRDSRAA